MGQPKGMTELMHRLFDRTGERQSFVGLMAQPIHGYDRRPAGAFRQSKYKVETAAVQIQVGHPQKTPSRLTAYRIQQHLGTVLIPVRIVGTGRNMDRTADLRTNAQTSQCRGQSLDDSQVHTDEGNQGNGQPTHDVMSL